MTTASFAWTVYGTMLALLLAVIGLLANFAFRVEARLENRISELGRDLRSEIAGLRSDVRTGFGHLDDRLRLLERDR